MLGQRVGLLDYLQSLEAELRSLFQVPSLRFELRPDRPPRELGAEIVGSCARLGTVGPRHRLLASIPSVQRLRQVG